ncbi:hypothetical protein FDP41_009214 [Naegleria fowleri]|uniref:Uncharacterized protein n=1 Tax=Naegleria fowleri TaxID=5763 RepID=A0A6A5BC60_NAEFO|nr:uncharacterized protein FDP41_009214 [Naegleria fowleri]KAF0972311.1 hypothetical protein FDP41_009214 [Naegleria fowleri]
MQPPPHRAHALVVHSMTNQHAVLHSAAATTIRTHEEDFDETDTILEEISRVQHHQNEPEVLLDDGNHRDGNTYLENRSLSARLSGWFSKKQKRVSFPSSEQVSHTISESSFSLPTLGTHNNYGSVIHVDSSIKHLSTSKKLLLDVKKPYKLQKAAVICNACFTALSILLILGCFILPTIPFNQFIDISTTYYVTSFIIVFVPVCVVLFITTIIGMIAFKPTKEYIKSLHLGYIGSLLFLIFMDCISIAIMFISTDPNYHYSSYLSLCISAVVLNCIIVVWSLVMIGVTILRMKRESFEYQYGHSSMKQ